MLRIDGRVRVPLVAVMAAFVVVLSGCGQTVSGTPHPEGGGPGSTASGPDAPATTPEAGPPTEFQEPSGRPTLTVQPDETLADGTQPGAAPTSAPLVPAPLSGLAAPTGEPRTTAERSPGPGAAERDSGGQGTAGGRSGDPAPVRARGTTPSAPRVAAAAPGPLTADVVSDECLLDAAGFAALLGAPVGAPAENAVTRPDGSRTTSCYAASRTGSATGAINVYRVNRGTPAAFVREARGGRAIGGVGEAAVLLDTVGGSTLQIATPRYLVTINVLDARPTDERWAAAGRVAADAARR